MHFASDHSTQNGIFAEEFKAKLPKFCPWIGGDLQVYDANGDGYDDLTCHTSTGIIQISESHIVEQRTGNVSVGKGTKPDGAGDHDIGATENAGT